MGGGSLAAAPDGTRLGVAQGGGTWREPGSLAVLNDDGTCLRDYGRHFFRGITWSPDGRLIAYGQGFEQLSPTSPPEGLYVLDTSSPVASPVYLGDGVSPAWHPSGDSIAVTVYDPLQIVLVGSDGRGSTVLPTGGPDAFPSWSPDGSRLAFARSQPGGWRLFVASASGAGARPLAPELDVGKPSWSADGRQLLVTATPAGTDDIGIFRVDVATGAATRVTTGSHQSPLELVRRAAKGDDGYLLAAADGRVFGFGAACPTLVPSGWPGAVLAALAATPQLDGLWQAS